MDVENGLMKLRYTARDIYIYNCYYCVEFIFFVTVNRLPVSGGCTAKLPPALGMVSSTVP